MLTVKSIIETVYEKWSDAVKDKVGNNYSMENSSTVTKLPYASLYFMGLPTNERILDGSESAVIPSLQVDIYTNGQKAITKAYEIDEISHNTLLSMGFQRTSGPELTQNVDPSIKRLMSRYSRVIGYGDNL